jgi:glycosyltransferase involved in cell wall biosynthesis
MIDIVLLVHDRPEFTRDCLESLSGEHFFRMIAVDNASAAETRDILREYRDRGVINRLVLLDRNYGVAPAANLGWELTSADVVVRLDNDIRFTDPQRLAQMAEIVAANPGKPLGALSFDFFAREGRQGFPAILPSGHVVVRPRNGCEVYGGCVLIARDTFRKLGYWCEDFGQYGYEDSDYGIRLMLAGYAMGFPAKNEGLDHLGESETRAEYLSFKNAKFEALRQSAGEHVLAYMLNLRPLTMRRRYRTQWCGGDHARLIPDPQYRNAEERVQREFSARLRNEGIQVTFPRSSEEAETLQNVYRRLRSDGRQ